MEPKGWIATRRSGAGAVGAALVSLALDLTACGGVTAIATQPSQVRDTGGMDWTYLLDPANGGPGEPPGYQQVLADMRANPKQPKPKRTSSRTKKPAVFPSAKHASID